MPRLGIFPTWIIYSVTVEAPQLVQYFPAYYIFNGLLSLLLLLNLVWAYYILKVAYSAFIGTVDTIAHDVRSDSSDLEFAENNDNAGEMQETDADKNKKLKWDLFLYYYYYIE